MGDFGPRWATRNFGPHGDRSARDDSSRFRTSGIVSHEVFDPCTSLLRKIAGQDGWCTQQYPIRTPHPWSPALPSVSPPATPRSGATDTVCADTDRSMATGPRARQQRSWSRMEGCRGRTVGRPRVALDEAPRLSDHGDPPPHGSRSGPAQAGTLAASRASFLPPRSSSQPVNENSPAIASRKKGGCRSPW
jgi:hypothetical protein